VAVLPRHHNRQVTISARPPLSLISARQVNLVGSHSLHVTDDRSKLSKLVSKEVISTLKMLVTGKPNRLSCLKIFTGSRFMYFVARSANLPERLYILLALISFSFLSLF